MNETETEITTTKNATTETNETEIETTNEVAAQKGGTTNCVHVNCGILTVGLI
jgi:hypothetical protein